MPPAPACAVRARPRWTAMPSRPAGMTASSGPAGPVGHRRRLADRARSGRPDRQLHRRGRLPLPARGDRRHAQGLRPTGADPHLRPHHQEDRPEAPVVEAAPKARKPRVRRPRPRAPTACPPTRTVRKAAPDAAGRSWCRSTNTWPPPSPGWRPKRRRPSCRSMCRCRPAAALAAAFDRCPGSRRGAGRDPQGAIASARKTCRQEGHRRKPRAAPPPTATRRSEPQAGSARGPGSGLRHAAAA